MPKIAFVKIGFVCFGLASQVAAFQSDRNLLAGNFTVESHPTDANKVRSENGKVNYIQNNTWVAYPDFDFGSGATHFWIEAGSPNSNGTLELWTRTDAGPLADGPTGGQLIASLAIDNTGGFNTFQKFSLNLTSSVSGVRNLFSNSQVREATCLTFGPSVFRPSLQA